MKKNYFILLLLASCTGLALHAQDTLRITIDAAHNCELLTGTGDGQPVDDGINPLKITGDSITIKLVRNGFTGSVILGREVEERPITSNTTSFSIEDAFFKNGDAIEVRFSDAVKCSFKLNIKNTTVSKDLAPHKIGSMVYDALYLQHHPDDSNKFKILAYYAGLTSGASLEELNAKYADNNFIDTSRINDWVQGHEEALEGSYMFNMKGLPSSIGGLDVTTFADGLAKFIVQRTKEELNLAFFDKFSNILEETPDLKTLFPETYTTLRIIGDEIYNYQSYLETLRENFQNDLNTLPEHLPGVIVNHKVYFEKHPELEVAVRSSSYFATSIKDNVHPGDMIADMPVDDYFIVLREKNINWEGALKTVQLLSESLRDTATGEDASYWVNNDKVKELIRDTEAFKIFIGLLYQSALTKYDGIKFQRNNAGKIEIDTLTSLINKIDGAPEYISQVSGFIQQFSQKTNRLTSLVKGRSRPENDSVAVELYAGYFNATLDILELSKEAYKLVPSSKKDIVDTVKKLTEELDLYFDIAGSTSKMIVNLNRRKYPAAVANAANIFYLIYDTKHIDYAINEYKGKIKELKKDKRGAADKATKNDIIEKIKIAKNDKDSLSKSIGFTRTFLKYGTFMGTIVQAENADEVSDAIEAFALPPGSSRIKRETPFNVSVNAYCGLFAGNENILGVKGENTGINSYGLTAPVGFAVSTGKKKFLWMPCKSGGHWSYSLFISVIDLGAVAAFRFQDDTAETLPTIQLKNLLSPGAFFSIGIPKSPVSLSGGLQVGPSLRKIENSTLDVSDDLYMRYSISVNVDIPILNLYTKSY